MKFYKYLPSNYMIRALPPPLQLGIGHLDYELVNMVTGVFPYP